VRCQLLGSVQEPLPAEIRVRGESETERETGPEEKKTKYIEIKASRFKNCGGTCGALAGRASGCFLFFVFSLGKIKIKIKIKIK